MHLQKVCNKFSVVYWVASYLRIWYRLIQAVRMILWLALSCKINIPPVRA